jgi:type I restriction enzyme R subunit
LLLAVQNVFLKNRRLEVAELYEEAWDLFAEDAVERWFTEEQVDELIEFTKQLASLSLIIEFRTLKDLLNL